MKTKTLALLLLLTVTRCFGAIPDRLDDYVYYEGVNTIGTGVSRTFSSRAVVLKSDGTYTGLFVTTATTLIPPFTPATATLPDGTYTYRKIDDQNAELTLSLAINGNSTGKRSLRFTSDSVGFMPAGDLPTPVSSVSFRVAPLSARAPLANCSNRSFIRAGGVAFTGFYITGESQRVIVRAVGPTLSAFGVTGALRNPTLNVFNATTNAAVGLNDDWSSESATALSRTSAVVGAFPLPENSKDSATILTLAPGTYIAQVSSPDPSDAGEALIEVYLLP